MRWPPLTAHLSLRRSDTTLRLWVPLFLVWLFVLVLLLPLLIVLAVALLFVPRRWHYGPLARGTWNTICETHGAALRLDGPRRGVTVELD